MHMLMDVYFEEMKKSLVVIEETQRANILKAASAVADTLENNGLWHVLDTGHMLMHEAVGRTGGMMALKPIMVTCEVNNPTRVRPIEGKNTMYYTQVPGFAKFVLNRANLKKGDTLIVGSVSGYEVFPVDVALTAKEMGITTIAFTSVAYSKTLTSRHESGKHLYEVCDIVLDNCAKAGDTLVPVKELGIEVCPSSGIGASYLMWALQASVMEELLRRGKTPSVYLSNHAPGATEHNREAMNTYNTLGY
ncbi:MAG: sugar isomerase domain-containing protein [Clostridia bacterium]